MSIVEKVLGTALMDRSAAELLTQDIPRDMFKGHDQRIFDSILSNLEKGEFDPSVIIALISPSDQEIAIRYRNEQVFGSYRELISQYKVEWRKYQAESIIKSMVKSMDSGDPSLILEKGYNQYIEATNIISDDFIKDEHHFAKEAIEISRINSQKASTAIGIPLPIGVFSKYANSLMLGELYIIGGRTGMGKSFWAGMIKNMLEQQNVSVGRITPEMTGISLAYRDLSLILGLDILDIMSGLISEEQWVSYEQYVRDKEGKPSYIDDQPLLYFEDIKQKVYGFVKKGCKVIVVDYIQIVIKKDGTDLYVGDTSALLTSLAKIHNICIIGLAQLNRESDKSSDKRPQIGHIYRGDKIAQDAYMVQMVYRPRIYGMETDSWGRMYPENYMEVIVRKHRVNGKLFTMKFLYDEKHGLIELDDNMIGIKVVTGPDPNFDVSSLFSPKEFGISNPFLPDEHFQEFDMDNDNYRNVPF